MNCYTADGMRPVGLVLLAALAGCGSDPKITGVRVVAQYGSPSLYDQFELRVDFDEEPPQSILLPKTPGPLLPSPQDLVVYLPDSRAGKMAYCRVTGRREGSAVSATVTAVILVEHQKVKTCLADLGTPDGGVPPPDAPSTGDDGGAPDTAPLPDGAEPPDGPIPDEPPPRDAPPPGVDVPPLPDAPPPRDMAVPPDAPVDMAVPPPDLPPDQPPPPPDIMTVVTGCSGNAARTAFADPALFPRIAGCGSPLSYSQAIGAAGGTCASGWHWCRADEVGSYAANPQPSTVGGSVCGWVDGTQRGCPDRFIAHSQAACGGADGMNLSVGGPTSGTLPCAPVDLGCMEPWKLAVSFDAWKTSSVNGGGSCLDHLGFQCASGTGGASCWITCCKN